jgi:hypothetical protein
LGYESVPKKADFGLIFGVREGILKEMTGFVSISDKI